MFLHLEIGDIVFIRTLSFVGRVCTFKQDFTDFEDLRKMGMIHCHKWFSLQVFTLQCVPLFCIMLASLAKI